jgi:hypothetical protein
MPRGEGEGKKQKTREEYCKEASLWDEVSAV